MDFLKCMNNFPWNRFATVYETNSKSLKDSFMKMFNGTAERADYQYVIDRLEYQETLHIITSWGLKLYISLLTEEDLNKDFVFGRVIETNSSVLVEIFNKVGSAYTELNEIISSGIMYSPLQIFWDGIIKKRWRKMGQTENYNKYKDSNYANLKMVFGVPENFRLREFATAKETPITREEMERNQYSYSTVWFPIDLENKIIEKLATNKRINRP